MLPPHAKTDQRQEDDDDGSYRGSDGHGENFAVDLTLVTVEVSGTRARADTVVNGADSLVGAILRRTGLAVSS